MCSSRQRQDTCPKYTTISMRNARRTFVIPSSYLRRTFVILRHTLSYPTHIPPRSGGGRLFRTPKSKMTKHYNFPEHHGVGGMSRAVGKGKGIGKPTPQQSISVEADAELAVLRTDVEEASLVFADRLRGPFPVCGFSGFRHAADPVLGVGKCWLYRRGIQTHCFCVWDCTTG